MCPKTTTTDEIQHLLRRSVELELNVSDLYSLYSRLYEEDIDFWWKISIEEKNHAALLRSGEQYLTLGIFPREVLLSKLDVIEEANRDIKENIRKFRDEPPDWETAYRYALFLENSAAELHFQDMMTEETPNRVLKIFQSLAGNDKDHARRIHALIQSRLG